MRRIEMAGRRFERWTVLARAAGKAEPHWVSRCDCGTVREVRGVNLRKGLSRSCGSCWPPFRRVRRA